MTIKELINRLNEFDQDMDVVISFTDPTDYRYTVSPESIEEGNPYDDNGFHGATGEEFEGDSLYSNESNDEGEYEYVGPKAVVIDLGVC